MCGPDVRVTVWNENVHEKRAAITAQIYPLGMHGQIAASLNAAGGITARTATMDQPEHGLTQDILDKTDTLVWWAHVAHGQVDDAIVDRVHQRVL